MSKTRLQDEYNKAIARSDIFIMLIFKKAGKYTIEEFEMAFGQFKKTGKPIIYAYFKDAPINVSEIKRADFQSVWDFQKKISALGHFWSKYENIDSLKYQFSSQLNKLVDLSNSDFESRTTKAEEYYKTKVFISYSHRDSDYLKRLLIHLQPLVKDGIVESWDDTKLTAGDKWKSKIESTLQTASVAILLLSADFLASDFIVNNELPPLLDAAEKNGTKIIPVIIKPCRFSRDKKLSVFQAINAPDKPLMGMSEFDQEIIYDKISEWVEANVLKIS